jgi:hypothetical protein
MKFQKLVLLVSMASALVACGGGGDTAVANADVVDKYVGTWVACIVDQSTKTTSIRETFVYTKTNATSASVSYKEDTYPNLTCAGTTAPRTFSSSGAVTYVGTKVVGADTVDKYDAVVTTPSARTFKDISFVQGNTLRLGNTASGFDANGYTNTLSTVEVFAKQ